MLRTRNRRPGTVKRRNVYIRAEDQEFWAWAGWYAELKNASLSAVIADALCEYREKRQRP